MFFMLIVKHAALQTWIAHSCLADGQITESSTLGRHIAVLIDREHVISCDDLTCCSKRDFTGCVFDDPLIHNPTFFSFPQQKYTG